jgi:uncharacterized protein
VAEGAGLPPEVIEKLREVGMRLDREGRIWHEGAEITHPRLRRAILSWLDVRDEDGRPIVRLDDRRYAYIEVDDAHLLALSARWEGDRALLVLNDGSEEELDYGSLSVACDHALYCKVRRGRLDARVTTRAYHVLAERIEEARDGGYALRAAGRSFPVRIRERDG